MRKVLFLLLITQLLGVVGFSQVLPPRSAPLFSVAATNFDIIWNVPKHSWPKKVWVYQVIPSKIFTSTVVSNLISIGQFTSNNYQRKDYGEMGFRLNGPDRQMAILPMTGEIMYHRPVDMNIKHLATNVPTSNELIPLTEKILSEIGINVSEITTRKNGHVNIAYDTNDIGQIYFLKGGTTVTNIHYRIVAFRRTIDGINVWGAGGVSQIKYGENGTVIDLMLDWRGLEPKKQINTVDSKQVIQWLKDGHCDYPRWIYPPYQDKIDIDWTKVKHLTVTDADPEYWTDMFDEHRLPLKSLVFPYLVLKVIVDTGMTNLETEIVSPLIQDMKVK